MSTKVTIRDVASLAGCSIATVSRVLNKSGPSSVENQKRVLAAAKTLNFEFNEVGRSLQRQASKTLGVIVPTISNPVFADAIEGVQECASENGYRILLGFANYNTKQELKSLETLLAHQIDGVVLTVGDIEDSPAIKRLEQSSTPYCLMFNQSRNPGSPTVCVDNALAAQKVGEEIFQLGHTSVAFLAVRMNSSDRSRQRYAGLCEAARLAKMPKPPIVEVNYEPSNLEVSLAKLFAEKPDVGAIFASNDMLALACIRALRAINKRVPEDVSIVGFDGIAITDLVQPSIATVLTPCREMGKQATALVIDALQNNRSVTPQAVMLPFEFRSGQSLVSSQTNVSTRELQPASRLS
ncbi:LacI family DNA-binding transcriptional regulator [Lentilitoribacter sp. Alg239-R112]|uniref:LacI family DNA-binding transcriptional regulator n=1 Tax=Lentilitoribacter sp. Alg239-R112 TaxID=2305987 RepID=UPI0013A6EFD3|nr:LacI family DNA-binding transcriptional regulator [Lentilitoribacter sp. Alg239-R112]